MEYRGLYWCYITETVLGDLVSRSVRNRVIRERRNEQEIGNDYVMKGAASGGGFGN